MRLLNISGPLSTLSCLHPFQSLRVLPPPARANDESTDSLFGGLAAGAATATTIAAAATAADAGADSP